VRVECLHHGAARGSADHDVAGQQQPDASVDAQSLVRERRVAGAKDDVVLHLLAQLGFQRGGDVDLGEHPESLLSEDGTHPGNRFGE
jgi:hypothetical protein